MEESLENLLPAASEPNFLKVAAALQRAQAKFDKLVKDTDNPFHKSKYATLDGVISATQKHLHSEGLVVLQTNIRDTQEIGVKSTLLHLESGEVLTSSLTAPPDKFNSQGIGSVITYMRRYDYQTLVGIAPADDDDGALASGTTEVRRPQSVQPISRSSQGVKPIIQATTSNTPTAAIAGDLAHATTSAAPATLPKPEIVATPVESASTPNPDAVPDSREYNDYAIRAMAVLEELQKAGLTGSAAVVKNKFKKYLCGFVGRRDIKELTHREWIAALKYLNGQAATPDGLKFAVDAIEAASAKEAK